MSFDDWLLFVHVAAAFAFIGAITVFTILVLAARRTDRPVEALTLFRIGDPANILVQGGSVLALVMGVWIAIRRPEYRPWDGWIIGAYVLWLVAGAFGAMTGKAYNLIREEARMLVESGRFEPNADLAAKLRESRPLLLHAITVVAALALLLDMIFKPGA